MKKSIFLFFLFIVFQAVFSQQEYQFFGNNTNYQDVKFKLINNLIVIPIEINKKQLNFILDTGVNKTIVFNASPSDSLLFKNKRKLKLQGLGTGKPVDAVLSENNRFRIKNMIASNQNLYITINDQFDLSSKMGMTIHGVIGYDLLKDVVALIQYRKNTIRFFNPKTYINKRKCRKCEEFPLTLYQNKPYIDLSLKIKESNQEIPVKMLLDSGGSDALWLFEYSNDSIVAPTNYFNDVLGVGLSGTILGKRSRIHSVSIGSFLIKDPTISFLDTISTENARKYKLRNGSIGNNILKRFKVWIDYPNNKIILKKTASLSGGFEYNMSGMEVVYDGKILVREESQLVKQDTNYNRNLSGSSANSLSLVTNYTFKFKPSFRIDAVLKDSPSAKAGVLPGDIILKINGREAYEFNLGQIVAKLQERDNKKIRLMILRNGVTKKIEFNLRRRL